MSAEQLILFIVLTLWVWAAFYVVDEVADAFDEPFGDVIEPPEKRPADGKGRGDGSDVLRQRAAPGTRNRARHGGGV